MRRVREHAVNACAQRGPPAVHRHADAVRVAREPQRRGRPRDVTGCAEIARKERCFRVAHTEVRVAMRALQTHHEAPARTRRQTLRQRRILCDPRQLQFAREVCDRRIRRFDVEQKAHTFADTAVAGVAGDATAVIGAAACAVAQAGVRVDFSSQLCIGSGVGSGVVSLSVSRIARQSRDIPAHFDIAPFPLDRQRIRKPHMRSPCRIAKADAKRREPHRAPPRPPARRMTTATAAMTPERPKRPAHRDACRHRQPHRPAPSGQRRLLLQPHDAQRESAPHRPHAPLRRQRSTRAEPAIADRFSESRPPA
ncbi:hypothetical protein LMG29739_05936 [Paraburkholderia solisilvae]|uniref:Uncharacterized protein n=1 Tax=Paraburkholderia solisilvae TaxID=624376 RepID=A0A6J5F1A2_9BURK|nr:hypothetical protein LMG29739_05936 [Paraburkholderia solisilvae]